MFANFGPTIRRPDAADYDHAFIREVTVHVRSPRNRRVELTIAIAWVLIAIKCWTVSWLVAKYQIPIGAWWVNGPTVAFAAFTTGVYIWRD